MRITGAQSIGSICDRKFYKTFSETYERLKHLYEEAKPVVDLKPLMVWIVTSGYYNDMPLIWRTLNFFENIVKTENNPSEDDLYEEIRAEFHLRSIKKTKKACEVIPERELVQFVLLEKEGLPEKLLEFIQGYLYEI